jgi:hypothetical protein
MIVAIKYNEDDFFSNEFYSKVGGVSKKEINKIEYEFLSLIDFSLFVDEEIYNKYNNYITFSINNNIINHKEQNVSLENHINVKTN